MNVVDSSAWLSYFADDDNAEAFAKPVEALETLLIPSIAITEVFKHIVRLRGEEPAFAIIAQMKQGKIISLDYQLAIDAAGYGVAHKLPLADSIIFATAQKFDAMLWTQDRDFEGLPGVKFYAKSKAI